MRSSTLRSGRAARGLGGGTGEGCVTGCGIGCGTGADGGGGRRRTGGGGRYVWMAASEECSCSPRLGWYADEGRTFSWESEA